MICGQMGEVLWPFLDAWDSMNWFGLDTTSQSKKRKACACVELHMMTEENLAVGQWLFCIVK